MNLVCKTLDELMEITEVTIDDLLFDYVQAYRNLEQAQQSEIRVECYDNKGQQLFDKQHSLLDTSGERLSPVIFEPYVNDLFISSLFHVTKDQLKKYCGGTFDLSHIEQDFYFIIVNDYVGVITYLGHWNDKNLALDRFINVDPFIGHIGNGNRVVGLNELTV